MKSKWDIMTALFAAIGMGVLILDSKTALLGASEGIEICVRTVIPSLFPFILLSIFLTGKLMGQQMPQLRFLCKLCGIPKGAESLLAAGLLGGYPVGAQCIYQAYKSGQLQKQDAHRLLGFCSNAGPAFIFGMTSTLFSSVMNAWILWGIHILSALLVGMLLPHKAESVVHPQSMQRITLPTALTKTIYATANICGWVIVFRILIAFFSRWFLWLFPNTFQTLTIGFLELANGCCILFNIESEYKRFILCAAFLGFGGICVAMQTVSVTSELGTGWYFPGKVLQCGMSVILGILTASLLYPAESTRISISLSLIILLSILTSFLLFAQKKKKTVAFPKNLIYNKKKHSQEVTVCYFERRFKNPALTVHTEQK